MPRRISSLATFFYKFILPVIFVVSLINLVFYSFRPTAEFDAPSRKIAFGAFLFLVFTLWMYYRIKKVSIDKNNLYVSNYRKEITIPLSEITEVREFFWSEPRNVIIHIRNRTEFGDKIRFTVRGMDSRLESLSR